MGDAPRFGPPDELAHLSTLGAHSVELKALLVPPAAPVAEALTGRDAPTWSVRQSYLLDTDDLALLRSGVEIRLRRRARGRYDLAVSARRQGAGGADTGGVRGARVEVDVVPGGVWRDVEMRRDVDPGAATAVVDGAAAARALLSAAQRSWACRGGQQPIDEARLGDLRVHGPLVVHRVKVTATALGLRRADLEHVRFPSGRELVELSTHCAPRDVLATAAAFDRLLDERAVTVAPRYRPKSAVWRDEVLTR